MTTMASDDHALNLGLGFTSTAEIRPLKIRKSVSDHRDQFSLTLGLGTVSDNLPPVIGGGYGGGGGDLCSSGSAASSPAVKREREAAASEEEAERVSSRPGSDEEEDGGTAVTGGTRKKLRLTKEQSALLEESFKIQSTLNPKQKQALADRLNLLPRQVEVWFQNRRARTKLKQTEVDCEYLKKCCETLTDENRRLHKELQELKALKLSHPFYMHLPPATLTMCPSCERIIAGAGPGKVASGPASKGPCTIGPKPPHLYNSFTTSNPSAAC